MRNSWSARHKEKISDLWQSGLSAAEIADRIGGGTRNAVLGVVTRMKLQPRAEPTSAQKRASLEGHFAKAALVVVERDPSMVPEPLTSDEGVELAIWKVSPTTKGGHVVSLPYLRFQHGGRL